MGQPIVVLLREPIEGSRLLAVYLTHGDRRKETAERGKRQVSLGRAYVVSRWRALLQSGRLRLPRTGEEEALSEELLD